MLTNSIMMLIITWRDPLRPLDIYLGPSQIVYVTTTTLNRVVLDTLIYFT